MDAAAHVPGTIYPLGGRPHLPTMCRHRTGVRRQFRAVTVLCYERGVWEFVNPQTGEVGHIQTAEGSMPHRYCDKHKRAVERSYRGATWRRLSDDATEERDAAAV